MRKRKIVILCLLTVLLLTTASTVGEVYMTGTDAAMTGSTTVRLVIPSSYTVQIPATVDIPYGVTSTPITIGVSSMQLGSSKAIEIAPASSMGVLRTESSSATIPYVLDLQGCVRFTDPGTEELHLIIDQYDWYEAAAGEYTGAITFQVSVVDREVAE